MLKGISPLISPALLETLALMGHGDEILLADAHYPAGACAGRILRADGLGIAPLLGAILPLFELDSYVEAPLAMMVAVSGDTLDPSVESAYRSSIEAATGQTPAIERIDRFAFYGRAREAFATVITGELAKYGNILLKKGVTPIS